MMTLDRLLSINTNTDIKPQKSSKGPKENFARTFQNHMDMVKTPNKKTFPINTDNKNNLTSNENKDDISKKTENQKPDKTQKQTEVKKSKVSKEDKKTLKDRDLENDIEDIESTEEEIKNIPHEILLLLQDLSEMVEILDHLQTEGYLEGEGVDNLIIQLGDLLDVNNLDEGSLALLQEINDILVKEEIDIKDIGDKLDFQKGAKLPANVEESIKPFLEIVESIENLGLDDRENFNNLDNIPIKTDNLDILEEETIVPEKNKEETIIPKDNIGIEGFKEVKEEKRPELHLEPLSTNIDIPIETKEMPLIAENINLSEVNPSEILEQVVQHADTVYKESKNQIRLQLFPENLGKLSIDLTSENDEIKAKVYVDSLVVKEVIENNLNDFRQSLKDKGINITNIEVSVGQDPESQAKNRNPHHRLENRRRPSNNSYNNMANLEGLDRMVHINPYLTNSSNFDKIV